MKSKILLIILTFIFICFPLYTKASVSNEITIRTNKQTMDLDGTNYKSDYISITNNHLKTYRVKVISGGSNYVIIDKDGKEKNTFAANEAFMVISKEEKVKREEDIVLRIESNINDDTIYGNIKLHVNWNKKNRDITIKTIDSETNVLINNAIYLIYNNKDQLVDEVVTTNYYANTKLPYGEYHIIEKDAPKGYKKSDLEKKIIVNNDSPSIINVEFENDPLKSINIEVTSKIDNSLIAGAVIVIKDSENNTISEFISNLERKRIDNLYYGTYSISEIKAPSGYKALESPLTFTIDENSKDDMVINVSHTPYNGVRIISIDGNKDGVEYEIINKDGTIVKTINSLDDAVIGDLESGVYTLREVNGPTGDVAYDDFEVSDDDLTTIYVVKHDANVSLEGPSRAYYIASIILGAVGYVAIYIAKKRFS
ncbi:MAG: hypothetical protein J6X02_04220 [Bacilli bacterium]|nr:hypothetical protein [Bacilli bacterium]